MAQLQTTAWMDRQKRMCGLDVGLGLKVTFNRCLGSRKFWVGTGGDRKGD